MQLHIDWCLNRAAYLDQRSQLQQQGLAALQTPRLWLVVLPLVESLWCHQYHWEEAEEPECFTDDLPHVLLSVYNGGWNKYDKLFLLKFLTVALHIAGHDSICFLTGAVCLCEAWTLFFLWATAPLTHTDEHTHRPAAWNTAATMLFHLL